MVALLQQMICVGLLAAAGLAFWLLRDSSVVLAAGVAALVLSAYGILVAAEFALLRIAPKDATYPRPTVQEMLRAWVREVRYGVPVFFWRQPFRSQAVPDYVPRCESPGIVFIHGLFCNRGFWTPWMQEACRRGIPFVAVELSPLTASIDHYVPTVEAAVARVENATGLPPLVICHSMGGLVARAWAASTLHAWSRVSRIITIGTPHDGTWLGRFGHGHNAREMRLQSQWLKKLGLQEHGFPRDRFTCWFSNADNIVYPASTASLPGADNRWVQGVAHVALAFDANIMRDAFAHVETQGEAVHEYPR